MTFAEAVLTMAPIQDSVEKMLAEENAEAFLSMSEAHMRSLFDLRPVNARTMTAPITFSPTTKIWLAGSHRPQARTGDKGIWRQIISLSSRKPPTRAQDRDQLSIYGRLSVGLALYLALEWVP